MKASTNHLKLKEPEYMNVKLLHDHNKKYENTLSKRSQTICSNTFSSPGTVDDSVLIFHKFRPYIPKCILHIIKSPLRVADYMKKSCQIRGITAVLALNSYFISMD